MWNLVINMVNYFYYIFLAQFKLDYNKIINKNNEKNTNNLLPILNNERNLESKRKLKLIENLKDKYNNKNGVPKGHNKKELNKTIKTEANK